MGGSNDVVLSPLSFPNLVLRGHALEAANSIPAILKQASRHDAVA